MAGALRASSAANYAPKLRPRHNRTAYDKQDLREKVNAASQRGDWFWLEDGADRKQVCMRLLGEAGGTGRKDSLTATPTVANFELGSLARWCAMPDVTGIYMHTRCVCAASAAQQ